MAGDTPPDRVAEQADYLRRCFAELEDIVRRDVEEANNLPGASHWQVSTAESDIHVRGPKEAARAAFGLAAAGIQVYLAPRDGIKLAPFFQAEPAWIKGEARWGLTVEGERVEVWQVSHSALQRLFFSWNAE